MDCIISPKNALVLDKLMKTIRSNDLIIDSTTKIMLQMVSDDKTKCCNIILNTEFFISLEQKNKLLLISKPKFYINKMKVLRIYTYDNMMIFEYEFENYTYRHRFFTHETNIYTINFTPSNVTSLDINLFLEVLKQIKNGEATISFTEDKAFLKNGSNVIKFKCPNFNSISFNLCPITFKQILGSCKIFSEAYLCWEGEECPISLIFKSINVQASYFCAV